MPWQTSVGVASPARWAVRRRSGLAGRMEGIAHAEQAANPPGGVKLVGDHAGHASSHGLAADDEGPRRAERFHRLAIFGHQGLGPGRRLAAGGGAAGGHVGEFEARDAEAGIGQRPGGRRHGARVHRRAGTVRQQHRADGVLRSVEEKIARHQPVPRSERATST